MSASTAVHLAILQRLPGAERLRIAADMSNAARELALEGIRHRHPGYSADQVGQEWVRIALGTRTGTPRHE